MSTISFCQRILSNAVKPIKNICMIVKNNLKSARQGLIPNEQIILRKQDPYDRIFTHVVPDISVVLIKSTLTIADSIESGSTFENQTVRVVSLSTTEITEITRFKKNDLQGKIPLFTYHNKTKSVVTVPKLPPKHSNKLVFNNGLS